MTPHEAGAAAQLACLLEVSAPKPGNVSPGLHFHDTRYEDFLASAVAIGPAMADAGSRQLGATIRAAIAATRAVTARNTNLGIVLLLAPLCRAALLEPGPLRPAVRHVLAATTLADATEVYAAIRRASPAGLGSAPDQDVGAAPTVSLREAMGLAAHRDSIAGEYVTDFACTFELGAPTLRAARRGARPWSDAVVDTFLALLATRPDSHIARKLGAQAAADVSRRAAEVRDAGGTRTRDGRAALSALDRELRDARNQRNPGTTADLTAAAIAVVILEDGWTPSGEVARAQ
jgi:triphosphoribosyl-dephospho-CoA synthase